MKCVYVVVERRCNGRKRTIIRKPTHGQSMFNGRAVYFCAINSVNAGHRNRAWEGRKEVIECKLLQAAR